VLFPLYRLRLKARLPDGFDAFAEVVEDMAALDTATGWEETADDAGDVASDVEFLRIIHPDTLYPKAETADSWEYDRLALGKSVLQDILKFCYHTIHSPLGKSAVTASLSGYLTERHLALTDCFCKIFSIRAAALDIVLDKFDMYCHFVYAIF
jgi:hypothetical protein